MNRLRTEKRAQIISALVEGTAINATARMTGVSKFTILKLLKDVGEAYAAFENKTLRNGPETGPQGCAPTAARNRNKATPRETSRKGDISNEVRNPVQYVLDKHPSVLSQK